MQPEVIGRYRLLNQIGKGAMASIYRARDETLGRDVAIKVLHTHLADRQEHIQRFVREAHALAHLPHPNIVQIYDFGTDGDLHYIVSEFVDGKDLSQVLTVVDPFPVPIATLIILQLLEAIDYAHKHGIIHRDIKLENVILGSDGIVKLTDFGIAHIFEWDKMTLPGALIGSPYYMAPEIIEGKSAESGSDIFSAGVLFYRLITGRFPFPGNNPAQVLRSILRDSPQPPHKLLSVVDRELSRYILECINKRPDERIGAEKLKTELLKYIGPLSIRDVYAELRDFYLKPEEYLNLKKEQFIKLLTEDARKLISIRDYGSAINLLNRAISFGAVSREVTGLLNSAKFNRRLWIYPVILFVSAFILISGIKLFEREVLNSEQQIPAVVGMVKNKGVGAGGGVQEKESRREVAEAGERVAETRRERREARGKGARQRVEEEGGGVLETESRQLRETGGEIVKQEKTGKGKLTIRTNPWADIYIDGKFYGRTPFVGTIELPEGKHIVEARNPFAENISRELIIEEGRTYAEHLTLPLLPATVDVILNVEAQLYIDGQLVGSAMNFNKIALAQGRHTIRIEKAGYRPVEKTIYLEAASSVNLKIDLVREAIIWKN
jgi:serine/threonine protein kinase